MNPSQLLIGNWDWTLLLFTVAAFALAMSAMSVGVLFSGRCLRGSCGGPKVFGPNGEPLTCATCPRRREAEGPLPTTGPRADGRRRIPPA